MNDSSVQGWEDFYSPEMDGSAQAVKVTVTTAGKITANVGGVALSGTGFDGFKDGVYSVALKKTQKITSGKLKGGSKVWELHLEIGPDSAWDSRQLFGWYNVYTIDKNGLASMTPYLAVAAQRNAFAADDDAKAVAAAVVASGKKGAKGFVVTKAYDEDYVYTLDCADCALGGAKAAVAATAKANGTVSLAGTIAKTKVSGSAVLEVLPESEGEPARTATARFFTSKFGIEVVDVIEDGEVVEAYGRVWGK